MKHMKIETRDSTKAPHFENGLAFRVSHILLICATTVFRKGFVAMVCAMRAIEDSQRHSYRREPSRRPSTWSTSIRCCSGRLLDSRPGPSVLGPLLLVCGHAWRHDVRTKFPSRVFHTPPDQMSPSYSTRFV